MSQHIPPLQPTVDFTALKEEIIERFQAQIAQAGLRVNAAIIESTFYDLTITSTMWSKTRPRDIMVDYLTARGWERGWEHE